MDKNIERFIRYAKIDTQADENTGTTPSTEKQKNLSRLLVKELKELGLSIFFNKVTTHIKENISYDRENISSS